MPDLSDQMPDARAVLAAAYETARTAAANSYTRAQILAAIGAGLATVEAAEQARQYGATVAELIDAAKAMIGDSDGAPVAAASDPETDGGRADG